MLFIINIIINIIVTITIMIMIIIMIIIMHDDDDADYYYYYMLMLVSMILTFAQGHSVLAKANNQRWIIWTTKQVISIKRATTVGHF